MKLTKKEDAWLERFRKTMAAAPDSLSRKISAYSTGDNNITIYDIQKYDSYFEENPISHTSDSRDQCTLVNDSESELEVIYFPFLIESTAG